MNMEILVLPFQKSDLLVVITGFDFVFPGEGIGGPHVDSSFYPPPDIVFL